MNIDKIKEIGFVDEPIDKFLDLKVEILRLKKEKNAVILAHFYVVPELQDIADFVGDSLKLSQEAAKTKADVIVFIGVHFMAETAKILSPHKKVLLPDLNAGCSLAESAPADKFAEFISHYPNHVVINYVNTTAAIKALSDVVVTSTNAKQIVESFPENQPIIFGPDKNLGNYINSVTGRKMVLWDGACHVHEEFSVEEILRIKQDYPDAKVLAHPECEKPVLIVADHVGSTSALLKYSAKDDAKTYIVATESGIIHQMKKLSPDKEFIPAPPKDSTCACNDCNFMKLNSLEKLYNCLKYEMPEVTLDESLRIKAEKPIRKMLEISEKLGL
ncbi:MAG: quinolinate synthase NadA [Bacteroidales bacterium]|jgi:quinolinate synthase|nr:quinolinate synthase NadA [Bacteroidales bacterium]